MSQQEAIEQEIDRYLQNEMAEEEKVNFENRMNENDDFRNEVNLQRSIIKAVRREQLQKMIQKEESRNIQQRKIRKLVFSIGSFAMAASLMGFFYIGYLNNCAALTDRYYVAYAYTPIPSRGGDSLAPTKSDSLFFDALKQLEKGSSKEAISNLQKLSDHPAEMHAATELAVKWYLALAYLKNGNKKKAKVLLQEIGMESSGEFYLKAKELLKEI
ncbi:MAG: hypothetical protein WCL21_14590 [Mariniphaga sp.]